VNGSNLQRLTNHPADDRSPNFAPDGTWVVFETNRDGDSEIYSKSIDGTQEINLSNDTSDDWAPIWGLTR